jgi:peptide deformylase
MNIVQIGEQVLRNKASEVPQILFKTKKLLDMLEKMKIALDSQKDGVAIAAPQIGLPYRIFLVSPKAYHGNTKDIRLVFINPVITKKSKTTEIMPEGCLSVRWKYGEVKRSVNTTVEAYDENGVKFTRVGGGLLSQIFQHETDHLDGVLFIDKAKNVVDQKPQE